MANWTHKNKFSREDDESSQFFLEKKKELQHLIHDIGTPIMVIHSSLDIMAYYVQNNLNTDTEIKMPKLENTLKLIGLVRNLYASEEKMNENIELINRLPELLSNSVEEDVSKLLKYITSRVSDVFYDNNTQKHLQRIMSGVYTLFGIIDAEAITYCVTIDEMEKIINDCFTSASGFLEIENDGGASIDKEISLIVDISGIFGLKQETGVRSKKSNVYKIFQNLIVNSIKHGKIKGQPLNIKIYFDQVEDNIWITYKDDGRGTPEKIVSTFNQEGITDNPAKGTGKGTVIIDNQVKSLGGTSIELVLADELNDGACFQFSLPSDTVESN